PPWRYSDRVDRLDRRVGAGRGVRAGRRPLRGGGTGAARRGDHGDQRVEPVRGDVPSDAGPLPAGAAALTYLSGRRAPERVRPPRRRGRGGRTRSSGSAGRCRSPPCAGAGTAGQGSHFSQTSLLALTHFSAAASELIFSPAIIAATSFCSSAVHLKFFRNFAASPPFSAKSALKYFCSGVS